MDELPVLNWWKIHETSDYGYLLHHRRPLSLKETAQGAIIFREIYDQFIQRFGLSQGFLDQMDLRKRIGLLKIDRWVTGDKGINTMVRMLEEELKVKMSQTGEMDFFEVKSALEMELKFSLDPRKISVVEFYSYFKTLEKHGRKRQS